MQRVYCVKEKQQLVPRRLKFHKRNAHKHLVRLHRQTCINTHTYIHAYMCIYTHTHTHTHTQRVSGEEYLAPVKVEKPTGKCTLISDLDLLKLYLYGTPKYTQDYLSSLTILLYLILSQ